MKGSVCAVVVTYNRKEMLKDCVESLMAQSVALEGILAVDNASSDGTPSLLMEMGLLKKLPPQDQEYEETAILARGNAFISFHYLRLPHNTGGAGGFYQGMKRAYELGYEWIWIMDDDVVVDRRALEKLKKSIKDKPLILASRVVSDNQNLNPVHRGHFDRRNFFPGLQKPLPSDFKGYIDFSSFVGLMVNRKVIEKIGYPNPDFFIYNDDVEYSLRISEIGKILLVPDSLIVDRNAKRKENFQEKGLLLWKVKRVPLSNYWRTYYSLRNSIYIGKKYSRGKLLFYIRFMWHLIKSIRSLVLILILDDHKKDRLKLRFLPYLHGLKGKLGRRVIYKDGKLLWL